MSAVRAGFFPVEERRLRRKQLRRSRLAIAFVIAALPPLVNGCEYTGYDGFPTVSIDDVQAGMDATMHLIDYGHRDIAVITGDMNSTSSKDRLKGFELAMAKSRLTRRECLIVYGDYTLKCGETATEKLLIQKVRPTAIFCFSDEIALGCMYALRQHGYQVPDDISVIGFDNIPFAKYFAPPLTTIRQDFAELGRRCLHVLLGRIEGEPVPLRVVVPVELVVRESTAPWRGARSALERRRRS